MKYGKWYGGIVEEIPDFMSDVEDFFGYFTPKKMKFFKKQFTLEYSYDHRCKWYEATFTDIDKIEEFYNSIRKICTETNFNLNIYEQNSFGKFKYNDIKFIINPPKQSNGDNNWYSYPKNSKRTIKISIDE